MVHDVIYFGHLGITFLGICAILVFFNVKAVSSPKGSKMPIWGFGLIAIGALVFELCIYRISTPGYQNWDFLNAYYPAGRAALRDDHAQLRMLLGTGVQGGFVNIPVVAYFFAPFAWLRPQFASALFALLGIGSVVAAWVMLVRVARLEVRERWLLAFLFLVNGPLINGFKFGNLSYFVLSVLAGGLVLLRTGRNGAAGAVLGLAAVLKPALVLFGLFFLLRRDWRGLAGYAGAGLSIAFLSLAVFGWADNREWFQVSIVQYSVRWLGAYNVQSFPAFLLRLHADAGLTVWNPKIPTWGQKFLAQSFTVLILTVAAIACFQRRKGDDRLDVSGPIERLDMQYCLVICLSLVVSPLTWTHYYAWLLLPTAFFIGSHPSMPSSTAARRVAWIAIALVTPLVGQPWSIDNSWVMAVYRSVILSHVWLGGLVWLGLISYGLFTEPTAAGADDRNRGPGRLHACGAITASTPLAIEAHESA